MTDKAVDFLDLQILPGQDPLHGRPEILPCKHWNGAVQHNSKPAVVYPPTHDIERIGPGRFGCARDDREAFVAGFQDGRRRAIAEQSRCNDVRLVDIPGSDRKAAQLDGHEQDDRPG